MSSAYCTSPRFVLDIVNENDTLFVHPALEMCIVHDIGRVIGENGNNRSVSSPAEEATRRLCGRDGGLQRAGAARIELRAHKGSRKMCCRVDVMNVMRIVRKRQDVRKRSRPTTWRSH